MNFPDSSSPTAPPLPPPSYDDAFVSSSPSAPPPYSPGFTYPKLSFPPQTSSHTPATVESQPLPKSKTPRNYKLPAVILLTVVTIIAIVCFLLFFDFGSDDDDNDFPGPFQFPKTTSWPNGERYNPYGK